MSCEQLKSSEPIETYVVNLVKRKDRKKNILKEFEGRSEFKVTIVEAIEDAFGALGLWKTICRIIEEMVCEDVEYILLCEDDHMFTKDYSEKKLRDQIKKATQHNCDLLLGGVSWQEDSVQIDENLFWTKSFSGLQFTIIFRKLFSSILNAPLYLLNAADHYMCDLSQHILLVHPFMSKQRSYSYSDATPANNDGRRVSEFFNTTEKKLKILKKISAFCKNIDIERQVDHYDDLSDLVIPTYIINIEEQIDRKKHITKQFLSKSEFSTKFIKGIKDKNEPRGLSKSITKIIKIAIKNDDDVIIICKDDHEFTKDYNKNFLIKNIIRAHILGADVLLGGINQFHVATKVDESLFWVNEFHCTQFLIVYKKIFKKILNQQYDKKMTADGLISTLAVNKQVFFPFISIPRDFGYSDITIRDYTEIRSVDPYLSTLDRLKFMSVKADHFNHKISNHESVRDMSLGN